MPPAPPRFSTIVCCPRNSAACSCTMRIIVSGSPPAAYGTTSLIARFGNPCASARRETRGSETSSGNSRASVLLKGSPFAQSILPRMKKLRLTLACWDYDRTRALMDGSVRPEGIDLVYLDQPVEETFFRMMKFREFDCSEMSLSSYAASLSQKNPPFIAIPAFPSRFFRHSCIFVSAKSGIERPEDLKGKRIGVPEYQMTAPVWIRGILSDDYGVKVTDVTHHSGGEEEPGRDEKLKLDLPAHINVSPLKGNQTLARMIADGEIDALVTARAPSTFHSKPESVKRL